MTLFERLSDLQKGSRGVMFESPAGGDLSPIHFGRPIFKLIFGDDTPPEN